jgi:DNA modification methylase
MKPYYETERGKLFLGDSLELLPQLDVEVDLVLTDPPYNIKKDEWDNIPNYINWCKLWILEIQRVLKDNGSFYFWHNDMMQIKDLMTIIEKETNFIFKQMIVWNKRFFNSKNKGFFDGYVVVEDLRNYQKLAEYCLFYTFQDETGLSKIMGSCVCPVRDYIRNEIIRAKGKIVLKEINEILGTATNGGGVSSAVLSLDKTVPAFITEEHYLKLRVWLNSSKEYEYLRKEYEELRKEYEELRYYFNNQKLHHSVWDYEIANKTYEHITPKPIDMMQNIIKHSLKPQCLILDPFLGSGTTAVAAESLGRRWIGIEKEERYCKIAIERLKNEVQYELF